MPAREPYMNVQADVLKDNTYRLSPNAVDAIEELEETARLYLLLHGRPTRYLSEEQIADLKRRFPPS